MKWKEKNEKKNEIFADDYNFYVSSRSSKLRWIVTAKIYLNLKLSIWMRELKCVAWRARVWVIHINVFNTPFIVLGIGICYLAITRSFVWKHFLCEHLLFFPSFFPSRSSFLFMVFFCHHLYCLWLIEWMNEFTLFIHDSNFNIKFVFKSAVLLCNLI